MKKIKLLFVFIIGMMVLQSYGQENFKWDKVDSVNKTKSQIYSDTKMYVVKNIGQFQSDDKDGGIIVIKGELKELITFGVSPYTYYYNYNITFLIKDNKVKLILDNVICNKTEACKTRSYRIPCIPPFENDNYPDVSENVSLQMQNTGFGGNLTNLSKKKQRELMVNLKNDLQLIVDNYFLNIKLQSEITKEW